MKEIHPNNKNKSTKKGLLFPYVNLKLTKAEKEVLKLITEEFLTVKKIMVRRNCSKQAVYKIIRKLKKKGVYNTGLRGVYKSESTSQPESHLKRLHGQEWNIQILVQGDYYQKRLVKSNVHFIDEHTVRLYRKSIEIYSGEGVSFVGETEQVATALSLIYWKRFFMKLEHKFHITLLKDGASNISLVNQHYGNDDKDFVSPFIDKGKRIRIFSKEDGKLWFDMDESFNLKERENPHPETGKQDSEKVTKQLNDWREHDPPTNSELNSKISELKVNITSVVDSLNNYFSGKSSGSNSLQSPNLLSTNLTDLSPPTYIG